MTYDYDTLGEATAIHENGGLALATFAYDDLGRRTSLTRANGTTTSYGYDAASRLTGLTHDLAGTAQDLSLTFAYNPAGQIASRTSSNDAYAFTQTYNVDRSYGINGLNQLTSAGATALAYDARGNLNSSGTLAYTYTSENRMATAPSSGLAYDPLDRLFNFQESGVNTTVTYDGADAIAEVDQNNGALLRRYIQGPGTDEPLIWYEGSGTSDRRWLHADERGSVVAVTNDAGTAITINSYDEYGIPASGNIGRFQYTGQKWLPSVGMYDYKARMYSPSLGRFMQTDPIGYGDGLNWYNYVGGDPVNGIDPSGLECEAGQEDTNNDGCADIVVTARASSQDKDIAGGEGPNIVVTINRRHDGFIEQPISVPQKEQPKPKYCSSTAYRVGKTLDFAGKVQQYTAAGAFVLSGGTAAEGALPAYGLGTAFRLGGTLLKSFAGDKGATADLATTGIIKLAAPPEVPPFVDAAMDYVADRAKGAVFKDPCE